MLWEPVIIWVPSNYRGNIFPMHTFGIKTITVLFVGFLFSSTVEAQIDRAKRYFEQAVEHHLTGNIEFY